MIIYIHRIINWLKREYRKNLFCKMLHLNHKDIYIVKDYTLINLNVKVGHNVTIYPGVMFFGQGEIIIGDNVNIGNNTVLYASPNGGIIIGSNTMIAADCYIIDCDHSVFPNDLRANESDIVDRVIIGEDVWLSAGAKVLRGSYIGNRSVVGANAVVKGHFSEDLVIAGVPAKVIKERLKETKEK